MKESGGRFGATPTVSPSNAATKQARAIPNCTKRKRGWAFNNHCATCHVLWHNTNNLRESSRGAPGP